MLKRRPEADRTELLMIVLSAMLISILLFILVGCGRNDEASMQEHGMNDSEQSEEQAVQEDDEQNDYVEGNQETLQASTSQLHDLAARYGCTVETYEFLGPYEGAIAVLNLPEGKNEDEAIAEFLEEPLVSYAYRKTQE
ncbi:MAG: hypothetical protein SWK76_15230 [Actinomycetota bacterium]|nr:hypothetical protein [Actinomycetota bacterium]